LSPWRFQTSSFDPFRHQISISARSCTFEDFWR
jgi:hypothetical protein